MPSQGARGRPQRPRTGPPTAPPAGPRLTGLGSGVVCAAVMLAVGCLDLLLFDGSPAVYGVLFLPVSVLTALWVRRGDLLTAPVVVPIGFAVGALPVADGDGGILGTAMGLVTALATQAVWLYGGTLLAGVTALVRRGALRRRTAVVRRPALERDVRGVGGVRGGGGLRERRTGRGGRTTA
ncbi:hypothetical protein GCM10010508_51750 [Streptomyces naganishii JCM 4654]|uniref:DUF6542 domain-containing protein n=2 Tax=Streptomyces naganishii TaxID=285447 RepID=A0A919CZ81_9ACTN|nr:hypothetical protein GCM10010508_51750 [Streptomyces naganishii JCM 4654]